MNTEETPEEKTKQEQIANFAIVEDQPIVHLFELNDDSKKRYEQTLIDLNLELSRLRSVLAESEKKEVECKQDNVEKLNDKDDIIMYLKRTLRERNDELAELVKQKGKLEKRRENKNNDYEAKVNAMNDEFSAMTKILANDIHALSNKILSHDKIKTDRVNYFQKSEIQQEKIVIQYLRHKEELYELEKSVIIKKNQLKIDITENVNKLMNNFENVTELRLASFSYKLIKDNVVCNNFLQEMLRRFELINKENVKLRAEHFRFETRFQLENDLIKHCFTEFKRNQQQILDLIEKFKDKLVVDKDNSNFFKNIHSYLHFQLDTVNKILILQVEKQKLMKLMSKKDEYITELTSEKSRMIRLNKTLKSLIRQTKQDLFRVMNFETLKTRQNQILNNTCERLKKMFQQFNEDEIVRKANLRLSTVPIADKQIQADPFYARPMVQSKIDILREASI